MQLYELEKRLTMDVKFLAKQHNIKTDKLYVNVQTSKGAFGHFSQNRWIMGENKEKVDELALNPEYFTNPLEVIDTMLHELVHVYCQQNNIKDTSRNGYYHNQKFKKVAEEFGLTCIATDSGWNTSPNGNEKKLEALNSTLPYPVTCDMIRRSDSKKKITTHTPRKKPHEYVCPSCGITIKHKDLIYISCYNCFNVLFEMDSDDESYNEWAENAPNHKVVET